MKPWKLRYEAEDAEEGEVEAKELEGEDFGRDDGVEAVYYKHVTLPTKREE